MALNWAMLNPNRSPVPLPGEMTIMTISSGADVAVTVPNVPPSGSSSTAGGSGGVKRLNSLGRIWLTDQRFIFTSESAGAFDSLSVPLPSVLSTKFEQPTFGANYLAFEVKPSPEGGLTVGTKVEVRFKDQAMFEFVSVLEKSRERAIYMKRQTADEVDEGLPTYTLPAESGSVSMVGGVPVENPPGYDV